MPRRECRSRRGIERLPSHTLSGRVQLFRRRAAWRRRYRLRRGRRRRPHAVRRCAGRTCGTGRRWRPHAVRRTCPSYPRDRPAGGGRTQFGDVPVVPAGQAWQAAAARSSATCRSYPRDRSAGGGVTQFGGVPVVPAGQVAGGRLHAVRRTCPSCLRDRPAGAGFTQFGNVPVVPAGQAWRRRLHAVRERAGRACGTGLRRRLHAVRRTCPSYLRDRPEAAERGGCWTADYRFHSHQSASGPLHRQLADCGFSPALQLRGLVFGLMVVGAVQIPFTMLIVFGHRQFADCGFSPALQLPRIGVRLDGRRRRADAVHDVHRVRAQAVRRLRVLARTAAAADWCSA